MKGNGNKYLVICHAILPKPSSSEGISSRRSIGSRRPSFRKAFPVFMAQQRLKVVFVRCVRPRKAVLGRISASSGLENVSYSKDSITLCLAI